MNRFATITKLSLLDDRGHVAQAYGTDALILVRPDGYIGLVAGPADTESVGEHLRSLSRRLGNLAALGRLARGVVEERG